MAHCTDAFSNGWQHMVKVLFSPFRIGFWLLMVFILFLSEGLTQINPFQFISQEQLEEIQRDPSILQPMLVTILIIGIVFFFLMLIFLLIGSAGRMLFLVGVRDGTLQIFKSLEELLSPIITYFLWNVIVPILLLIFLFVLLLILMIPFVGMSSSTDINSLGIAMIFFIIVIAFIFAFFTFCYMVLMHSFVLPQMVFAQKGIFASLWTSFGLIFNNLLEVAGFCLIRIAVWIGIVVVLIIPIVILSIIYTAIELSLQNQVVMKGIIIILISLPVTFIMQIVLLPVLVFLDAYSLAFLAKLTGDNRFLASAVEGNEQTITPPNTSSPQAAAVSTDQPIPPSTMPAMSSPSMNNEPVNFKDIPVEDTSATQPSSPPLPSTPELTPPPDSPNHNVEPNQEEPKHEPPQPPNQ